MVKYKLLTDDTIEVDGVILYRIEALKDFSNVKTGDLGGYIQTEHNLSHEGTCWISGYAKVFGNATVSGNAFVFGNAMIHGWVHVGGESYIGKDAEIKTAKDYMTIGPLGSRRYITLTRSNQKVTVGCFNGSLSEFKKKVQRKYPNGSYYEAAFPLIEFYFNN